MLIKADWDGTRVRIRPATFLGPVLFDGYRAAAAPSVYSKAHNAQICSLDQLPEVLEGLSAGGYLWQMSAKLEAAIEAYAEEQRMVEVELDARLMRIEASLRERGLGLFPYQREGARWLASRALALLADDMGLGKTVQILAAIPEGARVLVVCPAVVRAVWAAETARFRPDLRVRTVQERGVAQGLIPAEGELVAVSYDLLPEAALDLSGVIVVADEAHALKSRASLRSKRFKRLADTASRVWIATATPLANRPEELWSVLYAARLHLQAFYSWEGFLRLYGAKKGRFGMVWPSADKVSPEVAERLERVMLRRTKLEVLPQLPTKRWRTIPVALSSTLARACDRMLEELGDLAGEELLDPELDERIPFDRVAELRRKLAIAKAPALYDLVEDYEAQAEPLVVFSAHRFAVDELGKREGWAKVTGDERDEDRAEAVRAFQAGNLRGIALTIRAGGVGLTLTKAAHVVFLDQSYVPAEQSQAEDRVLRLGQTRDVLVTQLVADHAIDARVEAILKRKGALIEATGLGARKRKKAAS